MKMRQRMLTVLLAMVMALSCVQVPVMAVSNVPTDSEPIESAFTDAKFLGAVREIIGKTNGEHIYQSDVENITELEVVSQYIVSLDGIEYFTALKKLYCWNNDIVTLDLTHNPNLEALDCSYNTTLLSIDISNCPEFRALDCNYTGLQQLDLTNNPKLTRLICFGSYLKTLDISNNVLLEELDTYDTRLVSLDVSNNSRLTFLDCSWNRMCSIKSVKGLENCTALQGDAFCFEPQSADIEHCWDKGEVTVKPTCTEKGEMTYTCTSCGITKAEEIAATGLHTPGKWEVVTPATTEHEGLRVKKCTVCHTELEQEAIPKRVPSLPAPGPAEPDPSPASCPKDENCPLAKFTDFPMDAWYHDGVHFCIERKLMSGFGNDKFAPSNTLTRGMLAQMLYNNAGRPAVAEGAVFTDVAPNAWYAKAVTWAAEKGIVTGYSDGRFGPNDSITRQQLAVMLYRHAGSPAPQNLSLSFTDAESVSSYALDALRWAVEKDIVNGKGNGILDPKGMATRAEVAVMLQRYLTMEG